MCNKLVNLGNAPILIQQQKALEVHEVSTSFTALDVKTLITLKQC